MNPITEAIEAVMHQRYGCPDDCDGCRPEADLAAKAACKAMAALLDGLMPAAELTRWDTPSYAYGWGSAINQMLDLLTGCQIPADGAPTSLRSWPASESAPIYTKVRCDISSTTPVYFIHCDEGWRGSIVCSGLYGWAADWLLSVLGRQPYAPGFRPVNGE